MSEISLLGVVQLFTLDLAGEGERISNDQNRWNECTRVLSRSDMEKVMEKALVLS